MSEAETKLLENITRLVEEKKELERLVYLAFRCVDQAIECNRISPAWYFTLNDDELGAKTTIGNFRIDLKKAANKALEADREQLAVLEKECALPDNMIHLNSLV